MVWVDNVKFYKCIGVTWSVGRLLLCGMYIRYQMPNGESLGTARYIVLSWDRIFTLKNQVFARI